MAVVGIDFGTLNAVMAQAERGGVKVLLNENSKRLNANMVSFQGKQRFLGEAASSVARTNYKNTVKNMKRLIGRQFDEVQEELKYVVGPTYVKLPDGTVGVEVAYDDGRKTLSMTQCAAMMLFRLSQICESQEKGSGIADCVVSCPAYFTHAQRLAMLDACELVKMKCLRLMHDTTATALEYGIWRSLQKSFDDTKTTRVMFVDLGYSSYQVSVVDYVTGKLTVRATTWDRDLGGRDFDMAIGKWVAAQFQQKYGIDALAAPKSTMKLLDSCEKAKKTLSPHGVGEASLFIECLAEDHDFSVKLKLDQFEELVAPLLERLIPPVQRALEEAGCEAKDLAAVEIVGGGTRVASVKKKIADFLGLSAAAQPPSWGLGTTLNADECVSKGLAMQAAILSPRFKVKDYGIVEAVPYSIDFAWPDDSMQTDEQETSALFPRNSETPCSKRISFKRCDDLTIEATYGGEGAGAAEKIGSFSVQVAAAAKAIEAPLDDAKVRVTFKHTVHGTVELSSAELAYHEFYEEAPPEEPPKAAGDDAAPAEATSKEEEPAATTAAKEDETTTAAGAQGGDEDAKMEETAPPPAAASASASEEKKMKRRVKRSPLTVDGVLPGKMCKADLEAAIEVEVQMANADRIITETLDMRNEVEAYIYRMRDELLGDLRRFVEDDAEKPNLDAALSQAEEWLYDGDGFDTTKSAYAAKLADLQAAFAPADARKKEDTGRADLVAAFQKKMEDLKKWCNAAAADEALAHISDDDKGKVRAAANAANDWLMDMLDQQGSLALSDEPVLKKAALTAKLHEVDALVKPIMNQKPAPPPAAKDDAATKDADMPDAPPPEDDTKTPDVDMPDAPPPTAEEAK